MLSIATPLTWPLCAEKQTIEKWHRLLRLADKRGNAEIQFSHRCLSSVDSSLYSPESNVTPSQVVPYPPPPNRMLLHRRFSPTLPPLPRLELRQSLLTGCCYPYKLLASVVRRVNNTNRWITLYPVDNALRFDDTYPLYSESSVGFF